MSENESVKRKDEGKSKNKRKENEEKGGGYLSPKGLSLFYAAISQEQALRVPSWPTYSIDLWRIGRERMDPLTGMESLNEN